MRIPHTWHIPGEVKVASGDTDYVPGFTVNNGLDGQVSRIVHWESRINSGTSATVEVRRNGAAVAGPFTIGTSLSGNVISPVTLTSSDILTLVVTGVSATPKNLFFSLTIDYTV